VKGGPGEGREVTVWLCAECLGQIGAGPPRACNEHPFAGQLRAIATVTATEPWRDPYPSSSAPTTGRRHLFSIQDVASDRGNHRHCVVSDTCATGDGAFVLAREGCLGRSAMRLAALILGAWFGYKVGQAATNQEWLELLGYEPSHEDIQREVAHLQ
jgi:hypothetical protein